MIRLWVEACNTEKGGVGLRVSDGAFMVARKDVLYELEELNGGEVLVHQSSEG